MPVRGTATATRTTPGSVYASTFYPGMYGTYDPSGVVGSAAAINGAIAAAVAAGGGDVDLGYGTPTLETVLDLTHGNNVSLWGHGRRATVLKLAPNGTFSAGAIVSSPLLGGNNLRDFCLDCNGAGGAVIGSQKPIIVASSRSRINIELCNWVGTVATGTGANISGTVGISVAGHDVDLSETYVHDTYRWQIMTTSAIGASGATTAVVSATAGLTFVSGSNGNQTLVIDPSVNAMLGGAVAGAGSASVTPITDNDNPRPGAGMTTGMTGIYVGQSLIIDTVASGVQETVTVTAVTASSFTATFANAHAAGAPISYVGATETVQLGGVNSGTNTLTFLTATQLTHAGNVAIVAYAPTYDAIAVVGWTLGNLYAEDVRYLHGKAERLGEDPIGLAVGRRITIADFHAIDCSSGIALTDHVSGDIHDCIVNSTFNGQFPSSVASPGQIWSGVYVVGGSAPASAGTQPSSWDRLHIHHIEVNGYARGVVVAGSAATPVRDVDIDHVRLNGQGVEAIYLSGCKQVNADAAKIRNSNSYGLANDSGLSVAGILVVGSAGAPVDDLSLVNCDIVDDRGGSAKMQAGIQLYGAASSANANHIRVRGGRISGTTGNTVQVASMAAGTYSIKDVDGYNPISAPTAPIATPVTATWYQNTTGVDCYVQVTQAGVTGTHLYINGTNSTTGARDYGAQSAWPGLVFVPANAWIQTVFSAGTVTLGWQGT